MGIRGTDSEDCASQSQDEEGPDDSKRHTKYGCGRLGVFNNLPCEQLIEYKDRNEQESSDQKDRSR